MDMEGADMSAHVRSVVFDCPDPRGLASFYGDMLQDPVNLDDPEWCTVTLADPVLKLAFQLVRSYVPPTWPDGEPQQVHLDLNVEELLPASRRAVSLGAVVLGEPVEEPGGVFLVHADPAGHPFCLFQERERETILDDLAL
jgi:hypothetical protein